MSEIPADLFYTEEHEYVKQTADVGLVQVGITSYAQGELGDIVYVELPGVGSRVTRADPFGTVEAVKAVSDLYAPVSGEVVEVNGALDEDPSLVNRDPYGTGWMLKVRLDDEAELGELLRAEQYAEHIGE